MSYLTAHGHVNVSGVSFTHKDGTLFIRPVPFALRCLWFFERLLGFRPWSGNEGDVSLVFRPGIDEQAYAKLKDAAAELHNFIGNKHPDIETLTPEVRAAIFTVRKAMR